MLNGGGCVERWSAERVLLSRCVEERRGRDVVYCSVMSCAEEESWWERCSAVQVGSSGLRMAGLGWAG